MAIVRLGHNFIASCDLKGLTQNKTNHQSVKYTYSVKYNKLRPYKKLIPTGS